MIQEDYADYSKYNIMVSKQQTKLKCPTIHENAFLCKCSTPGFKQKFTEVSNRHGSGSRFPVPSN